MLRSLIISIFIILNVKAYYYKVFLDKIILSISKYVYTYNIFMLIS